MQYSKIGLSQLTERFEGCRLVAYQDQGGVWTIGYGHTQGVKQGETCTKEQAETWLLQDTDIAQNFVNGNVHIPITQGEFDALVDFTFNVGVGNFLRSTMLRDLNAGNFVAAANEFEKWDKVGGVEVAGLLRRRQAEVALFNS